ncbi:MAG: O-antigen ligase family protein [Devosiaceae bacterium]|nr:O-antigen ligase family protein [Devosiaceae bacterium]
MMKSNLTNLTWWALLGLLLLATPLIGTIAASLILILTLLASPIVFNKEAFIELKNQPMIILFSISFIVFAFFIAISVKSPKDLLVIFAFMPFLLSAVAYILARKYASKKAAIIILSMCLVGAGLAILVALFDIYFLGASRPRGFFSGVITLSMVGTTLGVVAGMGFFLVDDFKKIIFLLGPIFAIIIIVLTQSRGTAIALPVLGFLYFIFAIRRTKTLKAKIFVTIVLSILAFGAFYYITQQSGRIAALSNIVTLVMEQGLSSLKTLNIRMEMYIVGWELFLASPWIGYGWGNMVEYAVLAMGEEKINAYLDVQYFQFHNDFINYAFSAGIFGIASFFAFLFAPLVGALKAPRDSLFGFRIEITLLMLALYSISGLTGGTLSHGLLISLYAMICAIVLGAFRDETIIAEKAS